MFLNMPSGVRPHILVYDIPAARTYPKQRAKTDKPLRGVSGVRVAGKRSSAGEKKGGVRS